MHPAMTWKRTVEKAGSERCELFMGVRKTNGQWTGANGDDL